MISNQIMKKTLEELHSITKVEFVLYDLEGSLIAATCEDENLPVDAIEQFAFSLADSQEIRGYHFFKIDDEGTPEYVLIVKGSGEDVYVLGKVAVSELEALIIAYKDRLDRNTFIQNLLLDNLLLVDIYNRAKKLHIETECRRLVYVIETRTEKDNTAMEIMRGLFGGNGQDFITAVDERKLIYVRQLEQSEDYDDAMHLANIIGDMLNTEAMSSVRIAFGSIVSDIQQVSRSYKEAVMALNVGKIFYTEKRIHAYSTLGIGRLIFQLPVNLCEMFMNEVFTKQKPDTFDEETLATINKFFENNLNVSETARQLFVHRNTLVYRLEKIQKTTGLDIRNFDDALTFKIALMVVNYMKYMETEDV